MPGSDKPCTQAVYPPSLKVTLWPWGRVWEWGGASTASPDTGSRSHFPSLNDGWKDPAHCLVLCATDRGSSTVREKRRYCKSLAMQHSFPFISLLSMHGGDHPSGPKASRCPTELCYLSHASRGRSAGWTPESQPPLSSISLSAANRRQDTIPCW